MFENLKCITENFPWDWFLFLLLPLLALWWWLTKDGSKHKTTITSLEDRINFLEGELDACRKKGSVNVAAVAPVAKVDVSGYETRIKVLEAELNSALKAKGALMAAAPVVALAGSVTNNNDELTLKIKVLESELNACLKSKAVSFVAPAVAPVVVASTKDDLQIVEGIGPKIEELFNSKGIYTFDQLARTPASTLKEILDAAGSRFQMHDPTTWPEQGAMARDGKWDELKKWQDELNKGREK